MDCCGVVGADIGPTQERSRQITIKQYDHCFMKVYVKVVGTYGQTLSGRVSDEVIEEVTLFFR